MDVPEEKYKKIMSEYRSSYTNIINQYPISGKEAKQGFRCRNLKYIMSKATLSANYPYYHPIYEEALEQIKNSLSDTDTEARMLAVRLSRTLPFLFRIKAIELAENELTNAILAQQKKDTVSIANPYGYEVAADFSELLLSVFESTTQSQDTYFDVNQRIITIFTRFFQSALQGGRNSLRNGCQVLRNIFWVFGPQEIRQTRIENKLIAKIVSTLIPLSSFINRQEASMINTSQLTNSYSDRVRNNTKLLSLVLRCRQFEVRVRARQLYGFTCLLSYLPRMDYEILDVLVRQVFLILENISECDVTLDCFACLAAMITQEQQYYSRNSILKRWFSSLGQLGYKKQYLQYYIFLLQASNRKAFGVPHRLKYGLAIYCLELTKNVQQQFTRFAIYIRSCLNIVEIGRKSYKISKGGNFLLGIFQYSWFIDRINQENDLFKSQFLVALLHAFAVQEDSPSQEEIIDLLDICHRLIDWKCTSKEETHVPTLKFAFDMYLKFLQRACGQLGQRVETTVSELISRCNQPSIYFLFKFKLIATLLELPWYQQNHGYLQNAKINFHFIQDEVRVVMMPKNPKPIFTYDYSLTYDGEVESRKQIEYIKIIMHLLNQIPKVHENHIEQVDRIMVDYHQYLNDLQAREDANKQLVNCLQTLQADYYFNDCQKSFLLSLITNPLNLQTINAQTNLQQQLLYSHYQTIQFQQQINIFGPMSPVQLTIKLHPHPSYSIIYIHIKKNQWVQTQSQLKLIISSGIQKKQIPFQSSILQIKIDRIGSLHFQVWKGTQNDILLGSGNYRIKRQLKWQRVDHLRIIDGIKTKAYFKQSQPHIITQSYVSYYYGEPIIIHIQKNQNEVIIGVSSKDIWNQIRDIVPNLIQQLSTGSALLIHRTQ